MHACMDTTTRASCFQHDPFAMFSAGFGTPIWRWSGFLAVIFQICAECCVRHFTQLLWRCPQCIAEFVPFTISWSVHMLHAVQITQMWMYMHAYNMSYPYYSMLFCFEQRTRLNAEAAMRLRKNKGWNACLVNLGKMDGMCALVHLWYIVETIANHQVVWYAGRGWSKKGGSINDLSLHCGWNTRVYTYMLDIYIYIIYLYTYIYIQMLIIHIYDYIIIYMII